MAIRIERNEQGNCINFHGSSNPTYWNACLSGEVDANNTNTVNVVNDIITAQTGVKEYEFFQIPFSIHFYTCYSFVKYEPPTITCAEVE